jgi:hypothetical protein
VGCGITIEEFLGSFSYRSQVALVPLRQRGESFGRDLDVAAQFGFGKLLPQCCLGDLQRGAACFQRLRVRCGRTKGRALGLPVALAGLKFDAAAPLRVERRVRRRDGTFGTLLGLGCDAHQVRKRFESGPGRRCDVALVPDDSIDCGVGRFSLGEALPLCLHFAAKTRQLAVEFLLASGEFGQRVSGGAGGHLCCGDAGGESFGAVGRYLADELP